ncbi:unnamed protein product [Allacma fusca]|uniref:Karl n=1 Tax=Allacma fusca TaxID=39272 RepID=A0A8J2JDL6_9HEXA|nr:unnamed protein product [Allacma fusca]
MTLSTLIVLTFSVVVLVFADHHGDDETDLSTSSREQETLCPEVRQLPEFNIFSMLGSWYVIQYYSSSEEALTYHCMRVDFRLSSGNMDMKMHLTYRYADDPNDEVQDGNMTWQIPDPRRPEHWRHTEDHYKGVYNTDVVDTDYDNWLLLLHCSDTDSSKKFLSTFILGRQPQLDVMTTNYLRDKAGQFQVDLEYLFPVNQTRCVENKEDSGKAARTVEHTLTVRNKKKSKRSRERIG